MLAQRPPRQSRSCGVYQDQSGKNAGNLCAVRQPVAMLKGQNENGMVRTRRYFVRNAIACERIGHRSLSGPRPAPFLVDIWREIVQVRQKSRDFPDVFLWHQGPISGHAGITHAMLDDPEDLPIGLPGRF